MEHRRLRTFAVASYLRSALTAATTSTAASTTNGKNDECDQHASASSIAFIGNDPTSASNDCKRANDLESHSDASCEVAAATDSGCRASCSSEHVRSPCSTAGSSSGVHEDNNLLHASDEVSLAPMHNAFNVTFDFSPPIDGDDVTLDGDISSNESDAFHSAIAAKHSSTHSHNNNYSNRQVQFIDVLLQADAHGLGLNIKAVDEESHSSYTQPRSSASNGAAAAAPPTMLVVESFRRLHTQDVGPAEASQQIQRGDVLHSINGERVNDLQQLVATLVAAQTQHVTTTNGYDSVCHMNTTPFVLLRFLRSITNTVEDATFASSTTTPQPSQQRRESHARATAWLERGPHVALLVQELAAKNALLQDELVASRLEQESQRIQLEQLYALYAKAQLEQSSSSLSSSTFALLSKPSTLRFTCRATSNHNDSTVITTTTAALHSEIDRAVHAKHERLHQRFAAQLETAMRERTAQHTRELATLQDAATKKLAMLETGFHEALAHIREEEQQRATHSRHSIATCSCGTWMRLQHELSLHQSLEHVDDNKSNKSEDRSDCFVCALLTDARKNAAADSPTHSDTTATSTSTSTSSQSSSRNETDDRHDDSKRIACVRELLQAYDALKQVRLKHLATLDVAAREQQQQQQLG